MLDDGLPQVWLVMVASPGIDAEGDVAEGELVEVEDRNVVLLLEHDAKLRPSSGSRNKQDVEGCAGHAVAVMLDIHDVSFMVAPLSVVSELKAEFGELAGEFLLAGVEVRVAASGKLLGQLEKAGGDGMMVGVVVHGEIPFG